MSSVGEYFDSTLLRGIDENAGAAGLVQSLHGTPRNGTLELMTGAPGDAGSRGEPGATFRWEGDIADQTALAAMSSKLTTVHAGKAWRLRSTNTLMYWNGTSFDTFSDAFGAAGPDGESYPMTIGTVDTGPPGSDLEVTVTGSPPNLVLNLTVPRGIEGSKGAPGGPGPIRDAPDYADGAHVDRAVPTWDESAQKWKPAPHPGLRGPWSILETQAWDGAPGFEPAKSNVDGSLTVARLNIPAQETDWRPVIAGGVTVATNEANGNFTTRVDAEVLIGSDSGQIVALGAGFPFGAYGHCYFQPHFATRAMTPDSPVGVIPAGQPETLFVVLHRHQGSAKYSYVRSNAQIVCWARPVTAP
ncbi:hypothetical protein [Nocardia sp. CNY236]|uniref:hypothetical protein n=1 Tax=Nocardia sp. CNY236 TaxID=1169152 RepID=UPI000424DEFF|nr:hypothetical protein [Nocardia sp. CNY236]